MTTRTPSPRHINLAILTVQDTLFEGQVHWVQAPLSDGYMGIWPGHTPFLAALGTGRLQYETPGGIEEMDLRGGVLRIGLERVTVLVGRTDISQVAPAPSLDGLSFELETALRDALPEDQIEEMQT